MPRQQTLSVIAQMERDGQLGCVDLPYNNYIIREYPPLVPGGTPHCFVLRLYATILDGRGVCFRRSIDECMEYIDELNTQDGVVFNPPPPVSVSLSDIYPKRRKKNAAGI